MSEQRSNTIGHPSQNQQAENIKNDHYIIGIGASAGGLEAINELFDNFPEHLDPDANISLVIVQHLSPDYKSMMVELLTKHTEMEVVEAEDGMILRTNTVYLIPSKMVMTVSFGKLRLTEKINFQGPNTAIDIFFSSLAEAKGNKAIAVILSGTGSDGSKGIELIKKAGGLVIVQNPETAKFDGMPNSAISSGFADYILSPREIPMEIIHHIREKPLESYIGSITEHDEEILAEIFGLIKSQTAHDFALYKRPTILRRMLRRMTVNKTTSLKSYRDFLLANIDEVTLLAREFLIGVTRFFRDEEAYDILQNQILPDIVKRKQPEEPIKVWSVGCSTGEEAYSLAIIIKEYLWQVKKDIEVKIFATDIDKEAIDFASKGIYPESIVKIISKERLDAYFIKEGAKYIVSPHIRKMVIFATHNVIKDPPFGRTDLVTCRNMLIYLNPILQKKILALFHFSLNLHGYLFMGPSENPGDLRDSLEEVSKKWKIYKNISASRTIRIEPSLPLVPTSPLEPKVVYKKNFVEGLNELLLDKFDCAGIYVNEQYDLVQAVGNYKSFIEISPKAFQLNILKITPGDLSVHLGAALRKAAKTKEVAEIKRIRVNQNGETRAIDLTVKPNLQHKNVLDNYFLILLTADKQKEFVPLERELTDSPVVIDQFIMLQDELRETKANLQNAVEELETTNEELQSSNEELISANEELQSTNEELQSLNEELHTVNAEHQLKIKELVILNDDLNNFFRSTDIGQIFLDNNLMIRKFTPAAVKHINLIDSDIGRPITHISTNIRYANLVKDIREVIAKGTIIETEVEVENDRCYRMKIFPYVRQDNKVDGAVITFVDITNLKSLNNKLSGVLNSSLNSVMAFKAVKNSNRDIVDFEWVMVNAMAEKMLGVKEDKLLGKKLLYEFPSYKENGIFSRYQRVVTTGLPEHFQHFEEVNGLRVWFQVAAVKMQDGIAVTFADISDSKEAEAKIAIAYEELKKAEAYLKRLNNELEQRVEARTKELAISEERFRLLSKATNDVVWDWNLASNKRWWNDNVKTLLGYTIEDLEPGIESWINRLHPEDKERANNQINSVINDGEKQWSAEYRFRKADNTFAYILDRGYVIHDENNIPYRMVGSMIDLTALKKTQEELERTNLNLLKINADLDNFVYTASHDLKAPVSNIEGLIMTLEEELNTPNDDLKYILNLIKESVDRFKNTIKDLTDITKIQKDMQDDVGDIDPKEIINDVLVSIREMVLANKAHVNIECEPCPTIRFSKKNFKSIIYNLITNGIKYHHPEKEPIITVKLQDMDDRILLSVSDNGLGIPKSKQSKVFSMFKRFHDHVEGTGIGLYIVKRIVDNNKGSIELESEENEGTTFKVYLRKKT